MDDVFTDIVGHNRQLEYLTSVVENGNFNHAYGFFGPSSIGKYTIARHFAAVLLGVEESVLDIHFNVSILSNESKIKVEEIRELRAKLMLSTIGGGIKVAIINNAHQMNSASQNALLKILEEPHGKTLIILVTDKPELLLDTILSRSANIRFGLVASEDIKRVLKVDDDILALSSKRPGIAIKLSDSLYKQDFIELKNQAQEFLKMPVSGRFAFIETVVKQKDVKDDRIKELISIWRVLIHDELLESLNIKDDGKYRDLKNYTAALRALSETELALSSNSNKSLALQHFALSF